MNDMVHVSSTTQRLKNQPSNPNSCIDSAVRLLFLVAGRVHQGLQATSSFSIWGGVLEGNCFERGSILEGPNRIWRALKTSILNTEWMQVCCSLSIFLLHLTELNPILSAQNPQKVDAALKQLGWWWWRWWWCAFNQVQIHITSPAFPFEWSTSHMSQEPWPLYRGTLY